MTLNEFTNFLDKKIEKNERFIKITFFELRIEQNLSEQETKDFIKLAENRLTNLGYKVFTRKDEDESKNNKIKLKDNELLIGIREI